MMKNHQMTIYLVVSLGVTTCHDESSTARSSPINSTNYLATLLFRISYHLSIHKLIDST